MDLDRYQGSSWEPELDEERCVRLEERGENIYVRKSNVGANYDIQIIGGIRETNPVPDNKVEIRISELSDKSGLRVQYNANIVSYESCGQQTKEAKKPLNSLRDASDPDRERKRDIKDDTIGDDV